MARMMDVPRQTLIEELAKKRIKKQHTVQSAQKGISVTAKSTRKVELSWLHCRKGSAFKVVRMKEGGGTRNVDIPKKLQTKRKLSKLLKGCSSLMKNPVLEKLVK
jgi:site-specific recombinase XerC